MKILIVEDSRANLLVLTQYVERYGATAIPAENGETAVAAFSRERPAASAAEDRTCHELLSSPDSIASCPPGWPIRPSARKMRGRRSVSSPDASAIQATSGA